MIQTAKQFINENCIEMNSQEILIEFAKLHVIEALKQASEKACLTLESEISINNADWNVLTDIDKDSIINAYNLDNIK